MRFWLEKGIDGFRLDVFNCYAKDPLFRNNPRRWDPVGLLVGAGYAFVNQHHIYDRDQPHLHSYLQEMRAIADQYDAVLIGETLDERLRYHKAADYVGANALHLAFIFSCCIHAGTPKDLSCRARSLQQDFTQTWPSIVLSNHDFPRQSKRWGKLLCVVKTYGTPCPHAQRNSFYILRRRDRR